MFAGPLFVVSPHLDDAVLSCGATLALHPGSTVCTVFAGKPKQAMSTPWDGEAGFPDSDVAMMQRYVEDETALSRCGALGLHLPFLDSQYENSPTPHDIADALCEAWSCYPGHTFVVPLGLWHSDHVLASDGCFLAAKRIEMLDCVVYEEALYRAIPDAVVKRKTALAGEGIAMARIEGDRMSETSDAYANAMQKKWHAVSAYASQLRALHDAHPADVGVPERFWRPSR